MPAVGLKALLKDALRTRSGIVAIILLLFLIALAIAVPFYAPYDIVKTWNDPQAWLDNPQLAAPEWVDFFSTRKLPRSILVEFGSFEKDEEVLTYRDRILKRVSLVGDILYTYSDFPSEVKILLNTTFKKGERPRITLIWHRPDGEEIKIYSLSPTSPGLTTIEVSVDSKVIEALTNYVQRSVGENPTVVLPHVILFAREEEGMSDTKRAKVLQGRYSLKVEMVGFSEDDDVDAKLIVYGKVYGLAGTDSFRRDLLVGMLWGAPIALAFGGVAAIATVYVQAFLGALSAWYGRRADEVIQRFSDFMLIIPLLPILILISFFYRPGIWMLLLVVIVFGVLGSTTKVVRSMVLQFKEEQYIEAALSYGASKGRVLLRYLMPRVMPYTFALIATNVPIYIFLEAAISFLGLGDPILPTWGKIIGDAYSAGAVYHGQWWWVLLPAFMIMITTISFALLGYAFDKVLNPRLREE
jgi:peptide/nickel transport system permease protein